MVEATKSIRHVYAELWWYLQRTRIANCRLVIFGGRNFEKIGAAGSSAEYLKIFLKFKKVTLRESIDITCRVRKNFLLTSPSSLGQTTKQQGEYLTEMKQQW